MRLRQEQIVFLVGLALLGFMGWSTYQDKAVAPRVRSGSNAPELERYPAPEVSLAMPDRAATPALGRELFSPPRDTRPLPALALEEPPRAPLPGLLPPTDPGPAARAYGQVLRREVQTVDLPDLFGAVELAVASPEDEEFFGDLRKDEQRSALKALGYASSADDESGDASTQDLFADESPEERAARMEGYKQRYDWIQRAAGGLVFGRIENRERFALTIDTDRAAEPLEFVEVDPETGIELFASTGAVAMPYDRGVVAEFGFAATPVNEVELRLLRLGTTVTRGSFAEHMAFADWCVSQRLEAPRALEVAAEAYGRCAAFDKKDSAPRLGLARCFEAGFDFERAFLEYRSIVEDFPLDASGHVGLALLEARFLMDDQAEERLRKAVAMDRTSWASRWGLGRFLLERDRAEEAVEHLVSANRLAPNEPSRLRERVGIRTDLGATYLALGQLDEADRAFSQALAADAGADRARAGRLAVAVYSTQPGAAIGGGDGPADTLADASEEQGFDLLLARGLESLVSGDHEAARDRFMAAVEADPLRVDAAWSAMGYLAVVTGHGEEALEYIDRALTANPGNAYALYQRGRLLGERDDYDGARRALLAALEVELDFEDALAALGEMAFELGRFDDAERYLERAVGLDALRPDVHGLRGVNLLRLGRRVAANESFQRALEIDPTNSLGRAGSAWCIYLEGDATEALIQLAQIDEERRNLPEEDPWRVWARSQQERISEHVRKEEWIDVFNRKRLLNGWLTEEDQDVQVGMLEGAVTISGAFTANRAVRVWREYPAPLFVSLEADLWVEPTNTRAGIFVARERAQRGGNQITQEVSISRHKDGATQVRMIRSRTNPKLVDMEQPFPTGRWVRLRIERTGEGAQTTITASLDGIPLLADLPMGGIGSGSSPLLVGCFVEGEVGRQADIKMDNVAVVYRTK